MASESAASPESPSRPRDDHARWDELHALHFAGYGMWNYLSTPYLLARHGMAVEELTPAEVDGQRWRRLLVSFPDNVVTHGSPQVWYYDEAGQQRRLDYAPYIMGSRPAAHITEAHRTVDGPVFPTHRYGDTAVAWINGRYAGELAVSALLHPDRFTGPIHYAVGAEELSDAEIATILTEELRRPVRFEPVSADEWHREIVELSTSDPAGVVNPDIAGQFTAVALQVSRRGPSRPADADVLARLIGRPPTPFREYVRTDSCAR